jgi:hypothetical protein
MDYLHILKVNKILCEDGTWFGTYYGLTENEYKDKNGDTYPTIDGEPLSNYKFIIRKK